MCSPETSTTFFCLCTAGMHQLTRRAGLMVLISLWTSVSLCTFLQGLLLGNLGMCSPDTNTTFFCLCAAGMHQLTRRAGLLVLISLWRKSNITRDYFICVGEMSQSLLDQPAQIGTLL